MKPRPYFIPGIGTASSRRRSADPLRALYLLAYEASPYRCLFRVGASDEPDFMTPLEFSDLVKSQGQVRGLVEPAPDGRSAIYVIFGDPEDSTRETGRMGFDFERPISLRESMTPDHPSPSSSKEIDPMDGIMP